MDGVDIGHKVSSQDARTWRERQAQQRQDAADRKRLIVIHIQVHARRAMVEASRKRCRDSIRARKARWRQNSDNHERELRRNRSYYQAHDVYWAAFKRVRRRLLMKSSGVWNQEMRQRCRRIATRIVGGA